MKFLIERRMFSSPRFNIHGVTICSTLTRRRQCNLTESRLTLRVTHIFVPVDWCTSTLPHSRVTKVKPLDLSCGPRNWRLLSTSRDHYTELGLDRAKVPFLPRSSVHLSAVHWHLSTSSRFAPALIDLITSRHVVASRVRQPRRCQTSQVRYLSRRHVLSRSNAFNAIAVTVLHSHTPHLFHTSSFSGPSCAS